MALAYLFDPNMQFQDKGGKNNVNGFLRVFLEGTDDYARTYKDFNGTFNKRDIPLDNNGRCVVIVDEDYTYRIEVYERNGALQWTQYPMRPTNVNINYGNSNTYNMSADVYGTLDEIDVTSEENPITGFKKFFVSLSSAVKNTISTLVENVSTLFTNLSNEITRAQNAESALNTAIGNEVTRATAAEKAARTEVKAGDNIEVRESTAQDGHTIYTIDGVESVPKVQITSPGNTIDVQSNTDVKTNTKTFSIDVKQKPLSLGWFESGAMTYSNGYFSTNTFALKNNGRQNPQGDKVTYSSASQHVNLAAGIYHIDYEIRISWSGTPQNGLINIGGDVFDLSFSHTEKFSISSVIQMTEAGAYSVYIASDVTPPTGLEVKLSKLDVYAIQQVMENVVQGLESVTTDETLTGDGTTENPLGVANPGLTEVNHDETLSGTGTEEDPLSVVVDQEFDETSDNPQSGKAIHDYISSAVNITSKIMTNLLLNTNNILFKYNFSNGLLIVSGWGNFSSYQSNINVDFAKFNINEQTTDKNIFLGLTIPLILQNSSYNQRIGALELYLGTGTAVQTKGNFIRITVNPSYTYNSFTGINGIYLLEEPYKSQFEIAFGLRGDQDVN